MKRLLMALVVGLAVAGVALAAVNINTATKEELTSLKGIGEKRAQEIINYRTKNGPFKTVDDLEKVPGIGPGIMKQIRSNVTVSGKTVVDKPAAGDAKGKSSEAKKAEAPKSDAMKAEKAKEKFKADEKK
jgi:competence protein ComEA